jgi:membrane associated rhomboid family serine protease
MLFPLSDDNRTLKRTAWVTMIFIAINVAVYFYQVSNPDFTSGFSTIPREITNNIDLVGDEGIEVQNKLVMVPQTPGPNPIFLTLFSAMFMHGGLMHLASNMLFLYIFGDNVEIRFGALRFILFYVVSGLIAGLTHVMLNPDSVIPSLGASGAIAGVLGAYLVMFPWNRVNALFFIKIISVPAWLMIGLWGVAQFLPLLLEKTNVGGGVAYGAHVGGLVAGLILGLAFRLLSGEEPESILHRNYVQDEKAKRIW